ncbi:MAG: type III-B CRISPR module RAMP protein Cmr4 [Ignavibacteriales bacterium]
MYKAHDLFFMHSITPLHAGSGSSLSTIDLPVQREKTTNFPLIAGSGVKGAMREFFENNDSVKTDVDVIFGPDKEGSDYAGSASFSDAKLLFFPVKSVKGVFVWITCPLVLERFARDYHHFTGKQFMLPKFAKIDDEWALTHENPGCLLSNGEIILEDFVFKAQKQPEYGKLAQEFASALFATDSYWHKKFTSDMVILSDNSFKEFTEYSTEVQARIRIDDKTGTVADGALFYEENIPSETIFYCSLNISDPHKKTDSASVSSADAILNTVKNTSSGKVIQFGGDATIGKGMMQITYFGKGE